MKEIKRKFNLTFDELRFKVGDVVGYMTRDETEFTARGITTVDRDAFEVQGNTFEVFPTDQYYQGQVTIEVQAKDAARESTMAKVRILASQVQQIFGNRSGQYKMLGMKDLNKKADGLFITLARGVAKVGEDYLAELSAAGVTQAQLDALLADAQLMEDKFHAIRSKEALRDNKTEERVTLANALYDNLSKYCAIGKSIWEGVSEAKHNDYVINSTEHHGLSKVQNLLVSLGTGNPYDAEISWSPVVGATEYELHISEVPTGEQPGTFSLANTVTATNIVYGMNPGLRYWFKIRGKNTTKVGYYSDEAFLDAP